MEEDDDDDDDDDEFITMHGHLNVKSVQRSTLPTKSLIRRLEKKITVD